MIGNENVIPALALHPAMVELREMGIGLPPPGGPALPEIGWIWDGVLARGALTLLHVAPKVGKSSLLADLLAARRGGAMLYGREVGQGRSLVVTEEGAEIWQRRACRRGIDRPSFEVMSRPFDRGRATEEEWQKTCKALAVALPAHEIDLLAIDSFGNLLPCEDENGPSQAGKPLGLLTPVLRAGVAVLILHHSTKARSRSAVNSSRGSNALPGSADIVARLDAHGAARTRRITVVPRDGYGEAFVATENPSECEQEGTDPGPELRGDDSTLPTRTPTLKDRGLYGFMDKVQELENDANGGEVLYADIRGFSGTDKGRHYQEALRRGLIEEVRSNPRTLRRVRDHAGDPCPLRNFDDRISDLKARARPY